MADLTASNAGELLGDAGVILDGTDNFDTRYLLNDFAVSRGIPWIYGAAVGSYGLAMPVIPGRTACLRCVYPDPPAGPQPTCETAGVLNAIVSAVASLQVADALKILCGHAAWSRRASPPSMSGTAASARSTARRGTPIAPPACGASFLTWKNRARPPVRMCGRDAVQVREREGPIDLEELRARLEPLGEVRSTSSPCAFCPSL